MMIDLRLRLRRGRLGVGLGGTSGGAARWLLPLAPRVISARCARASNQVTGTNGAARGPAMGRAVRGNDFNAQKHWRFCSFERLPQGTLP